VYTNPVGIIEVEEIFHGFREEKLRRDSAILCTGALVAKVVEEKQRLRPLILNKSSRKRKRSACLKGSYNCH
jgi:hypothetical protein